MNTLIKVVLSVLFILSAGPGFSQDGTVNFSFDQVDIRSFVKLVGDLTGKKFVVADNVTGKITVVSPQVTKAEVYPLFVSILESSGYSVSEEGQLLKIIALPQRDAPLATVVGEGKPVPQSGVYTRVIKLKNVSVAGIKKALDAQVSGGKQGALAIVEETNHLIMTDTAENIRRVEKVIEEIDKQGTARGMVIVKLQFASADDLSQQLNAAMAENPTKSEQILKRLPGYGNAPEVTKKSAVVVPVQHANSLILVGSETEIAELKSIIAEMDVDTPTGRGRMNAIILKYITAEEAAKSINGLLGRTPIQKGQTSSQAQQNASAREIAIEPMSTINAILVDAMPGDFEVVKKLIEQIDVIPQQVHITVMIAEKNATDGLSYGFELAALEMPGKVGDSVVQGGVRLTDSATSIMDTIQKGVMPKGMTVGVAYGTQIGTDGKVTASFPGVVNIDAIKKSGIFKVRSETSLEAQDNKEATINIVNQIPVLKSTISGGSGTSRDVIQNIDRMDVGIKLKLKPHIIPGGDVQMDLNPSIEAVIDPGPSGTQFAPTIAKREVNTTVTVADGKMIVIAGLTREDKTTVDRKIPLLGSIPLIGTLFSSKSDSTEKTDLLIFVTPKIVNKLGDDAVKKEWEDKTGLGPKKQGNEQGQNENNK